MVHIIPCAECGLEIGFMHRDVKPEQYCRACTYRHSHTIVCDDCLMPSVVCNPRKARYCAPCAARRGGPVGGRVRPVCAPSFGRPCPTCAARRGKAVARRSNK